MELARPRQTLEPRRGELKWLAGRTSKARVLWSARPCGQVQCQRARWVGPRRARMCGLATQAGAFSIPFPQHQDEEQEEVKQRQLLRRRRHASSQLATQPAPATISRPSWRLRCGKAVGSPPDAATRRKRRPARPAQRRTSSTSRRCGDDQEGESNWGSHSMVGSAEVEDHHRHEGDEETSDHQGC